MIDSRRVARQTEATIDRQLWIIRHADAQPPGPGASDPERPLSARGVVDCARIVTALEALAARTERMVTSDARRARATAELLAPVFGCPAEQLIVDHALYSATSDVLLRCIRATPPDTRTLVLVGHNPGVSDLLARLLVTGWRHALPPLGAVCARSDLPWEALDDRSARLEHYLDPTDLG
jgi:phosphohistidine phosphatase